MGHIESCVFRLKERERKKTIIQRLRLLSSKQLAEAETGIAFLRQAFLRVNPAMHGRNTLDKYARLRHANVYGHTTLKAPVLVRSPKLSNVGPG